MRKILSITLLGAIAMLSGPAHADNKTGTIMLPTGTVARAHRCAYTVDQQASQGVLGYTVKVTPEARFSLKATAGSSADFEIAFYSDPPAPCDADSNSGGDYTNHNAPLDDTSDESGDVPDIAEYAIITMFAGEPNSTFTYTES